MADRFDEMVVQFGAVLPLWRSDLAALLRRVAAEERARCAAICAAEAARAKVDGEAAAERYPGVAGAADVYTGHAHGARRCAELIQGGER